MMRSEESAPTYRDGFDLFGLPFSDGIEGGFTWSEADWAKGDGSCGSCGRVFGVYILASRTSFDISGFRMLFLFPPLSTLL